MSSIETMSDEQFERHAPAAIARLRRQRRTAHLGRPRLVVDRDRARRLRKEGWSVRKIADELGVSAMTVQRIVTAA
jgi:DNA invertase Pin-like site-specific DNA recombinase